MEASARSALYRRAALLIGLAGLLLWAAGSDLRAVAQGDLGLILPARFSDSPVATATPGTSPVSTITPSPTVAAATSTPWPTSTPRPTSTAPSSLGPVESRLVQVWADQTGGAVTAPLQGTGTQAEGQEIVFGVHRTSDDEIVRARTYFHFPLDVFPPGTKVVNAKLYVFVDGSAGFGETTVGVYRPLEAWQEAEWSTDPTTWPALSDSPLAVTVGGFTTTTASLPVVSRPGGGVAAPFVSPLPTPTLMPTGDPLSLLSGPVTLEQEDGVWLVWDVTVLVWAWLAEDVPDYGLAVAPAPAPNADPEDAGDLLMAHWFSTDDVTTRPHLIADIDIYPVTPTPAPTPIPILPAAGGSVDWMLVGIVLVGAALILLGLSVQREPGRAVERKERT